MNRRLNSLVNGVARARDGDAGTIEDVYFDDLTWTVRYLAVRIPAGEETRTVLIAASALGKTDWKKRVFRVDLNTAKVQESPAIALQPTLSRQEERTLQEYYAWPAYWVGGFYASPGYGLGLHPYDPASISLRPEPETLARLDPNLHSARHLAGFTIHATDGNIGHVEDFLVDDETWKIGYFVVNTHNWLPDRLVLISPRWIKPGGSWADRRVLVDLTREAVKQSPRFNPAKGLTRAQEAKLEGHYQKPPPSEWVVFQFHAPPGSEVYVAGTFNNWNPATIRLSDHGKGLFTTTILLPLGRYEYKFIVNGVWQAPPGNTEQVPNALGTTNSVLVVSRGKEQPAHRHTFSRFEEGDAGLLWRPPT